MIATARREVRVDVRWVVAGAWLLAAAAELTGRGSLFNHDTLIHGGLPRPAALALFLVAWQFMVAAMMLPSALPLIRLFDRASASQPRARAARVAFVASYVLVWTAFGAGAFLFDTVVHATVDASPWLLAHAYLIAGGTLIVAGLFQFSPLKEACLRQCRNPGAFLIRHYRRGVDRAFMTGLWHGVFCLGCCWALMLVAFAMGMANLVWMAALTAADDAREAGPERRPAGAAGRRLDGRRRGRDRRSAALRFGVAPVRWGALNEHRSADIELTVLGADGTPLRRHGRRRRPGRPRVPVRLHRLPGDRARGRRARRGAASRHGAAPRATGSSSSTRRRCRSTGAGSSPSAAIPTRSDSAPPPAGSSTEASR